MLIFSYIVHNFFFYKKGAMFVLSYLFFLSSSVRRLSYYIPVPKEKTINTCPAFSSSHSTWPCLFPDKLIILIIRQRTSHRRATSWAALGRRGGGEDLGLAAARALGSHAR